MKAVIFIFRKLYWLAVALVPLLPAYVYAAFPEIRNCSAIGICSQTTSVHINNEAISIVYFSFALLLPLCIWKLAGESLFRRTRLLQLIQKKASAKFFSISYWLMVALIPLLLWYMFGTFFAPYDCATNSNCYQFYVPLSNESKIAVFVSSLILWPLCARKLSAALWKSPSSV